MDMGSCSLLCSPLLSSRWPTRRSTLPPATRYAAETAPGRRQGPAASSPLPGGLRGGASSLAGGARWAGVATGRPRSPTQRRRRRRSADVTADAGTFSVNSTSVRLVSLGIIFPESLPSSLCCYG